MCSFKIIFACCIISLAFLYWLKMDSLITSHKFLYFQQTPSEPKRYLSSNLAASSRLGNHLFELSALLAISRKLNRIPTFFIQDSYYDQMLKDSDELIPGLLDHYLIVNGTVPASIVPFEFNILCCKWDNPDRLMNITDEYLHIYRTHYQSFSSWKYFPRMRNELISYLREPTNNYIDLPKSDDNTSVTCVHIRRTDFVNSGFFVPDEKFILDAIKFVEKTENKFDSSKQVYVFFGDDIAYVENLQNSSFFMDDNTERHLKNISFISHNTPSDSMIYASLHCDVVLFTSPHSTFGWWLGFLSKGNQVYYSDPRYVDDNSLASGLFDADDYYPPHWTPFKYDGPDNSTFVESLK